MHKIKILASIISIGLLVSSCNLYTENESTTRTIELVFGNSGSRSAVYDSADVDTVWVKAFDADGIQIPDLNTDDSGESGVAVLTRNESSSTWRGTIKLDYISGAVVLHAMGVDEDTGEVIYQGTSDSISNFASDAITIPSSLGYDAGDRGPGGGYVFHDKGSFSDGWRYIEAAPAGSDGDFTDYDDRKLWGDVSKDVSTSTAVGSGASNTAAIVLADSTAGIAARVCSDADFNGYDDWFLPSLYELNAMGDNLQNQGLGGFSSSFYWSSTQYDLDDAYGDNFIQAYRIGRKDTLNRARAARYF